MNLGTPLPQLAPLPSSVGHGSNEQPVSLTYAAHSLPATERDDGEEKTRLSPQSHLPPQNTNALSRESSRLSLPFSDAPSRDFNFHTYGFAPSSSLPSLAADDDWRETHTHIRVPTVHLLSTLQAIGSSPPLPDNVPGWIGNPRTVQTAYRATRDPDDNEVVLLRFLKKPGHLSAYSTAPSAPFSLEAAGGSGPSAAVCHVCSSLAIEAGNDVAWMQCTRGARLEEPDFGEC